jgi:S-DNA-T family DNA segregation ATPase FtsK/SpoIIIE
MPVKTRRRKKIARPKRPASRQRFRVKAPGLPRLHVPPKQQRELAGITCLALAALVTLAVLVPSEGSAMHALHSGLWGLFGWGVVFLIGVAVAAGVELLAPWIEVMTLGRVLGLALLLASVLGLLDLPGGEGGSIGRAEGEALQNIAGWAGSVLILATVLLGSLVLAFDVSISGLLAAIQARYAQAEPKKVSRTTVREKVESRRPRPQPLPKPAEELQDPMLVPVQGLAAEPEADVIPLAAAPAVEPDIILEPAARPRRSPSRKQESPVPAGSEAPAAEGLPAIGGDQVMDDDQAKAWVKPDLSLLDNIQVRRERLQDEIKHTIRTIEQTLGSFDVEASVIGVNSGPSVTQYELQPARGVPVRKITSLQNDLALALSAAIRIQAPIPGKPAVGIEVPNKATAKVTLREIIATPAFQDDKTLLSLAIGTDVSGNSVVGDLTRMPHMLIAGATGSGKSVCINALLAGLMFQATPDELKLILIDPKRVEFTQYADIPHLLVPVVTESEHATSALRWAVTEMENRYKLFAGHTVRNIADFNQKAPEMGLNPLPYIVIVIDELADLMMVAAGEIEELICRIAQLARAVGIHLVVATQRPSADIITGLIKANIPSRIAFAVSSSIDSRVILDETGAEKLLGRGDMLYLPVEAGKSTRLQGVYVSDKELKALVDFWRAQGRPQYQEEIFNVEATVSWAKEGQKRDPLFGKGAHVVATEGRASVSLLQRKLNVGYTRAARIVDQLAEHRVIGPYEGSKSREVLMNLLEVDQLVKELEES